MIINFIIMDGKERRIEMGSAKRLLIAVSIVVVASFAAPSVAVGQGADEANWPVKATFASPIQIGSMVLSPGTYDFQLTSGTTCRNVVEIYSVDQHRWLGMVMGVNDTRQDTSRRSGFTFENIGENAPTAIQYWFYPEWNRGIKFVYRKAKAVDTMAEAKASGSR
jgi:hypothetical protein